MTRVHVLASAALALAAAGCGPGDGSDRAMADLRSRVEAQAAEVESLRRQLAETDARARLLEERAAAATPPVPGAAVPASSAAPAAGPAEAAEEAAPAPDASSTEAYFESESGRQRLEAALEAVERRRQEQAAKERRERTRAMIEERVKGTLTERLGLDAQQQQTVLRVAVEAAERAEELFAGLREGRGDPSAFAQAREKGQQIRNDAMGQLQQALTVDQYNKLQEVMAEDRGGFLGFGGRGAIGGGGAGR